MAYLPQVIFIIVAAVAVLLFVIKVKKIRRNIFLGQDVKFLGSVKERWIILLKVAIGQGKMTKKPISGILHIIVYVGFVLINVEVIEIIVDGAFGTHRFLSGLFGSFYNFMIGSFEILALGVLLACEVFLVRRNVLKIKRFFGKEMTSWPKNDANIILIVEVLLMSAFLLMNAADYQLQLMGVAHYAEAGAFPISSFLLPFLDGMTVEGLILIERFCWWFHIVGILAFLNYLPYSKHFHIILAFPNVFYSKLVAYGKLTNLSAVTEQVKLMMDPSIDPYAAPTEGAAEPSTFGAKDVTDLPWTSIMHAYTCTECGRCTDECPANKTGKLLSPRKIMMDVRDRAEQLGAHKDKNGADAHDNIDLLSYITKEELWACTSCNACTEACPVNNDPLAVIVDLRRYLVMEQSAAPQELNLMFGNIENNGAPWQFPMSDRYNWAEEE
ncbi:MAG: heterodisulfide reductase subunit C [Glaciecola sp.]|jgi:heterodisulfide reductase subunit C